jgi:hypothetical protein
MPTKTGNPRDGSLARVAAMIQEQARQSAAFSRLPRVEREAAFQAVKEQQGGYAVVRLSDMIAAHEALAGGAL